MEQAQAEGPAGAAQGGETPVISYLGSLAWWARLRLWRAWLIATGARPEELSMPIRPRLGRVRRR